MIQSKIFWMRLTRTHTYTHVSKWEESSLALASAKMKIELNCTIYTLNSESETAISFKMRSFKCIYAFADVLLLSILPRMYIVCIYFLSNWPSQFKKWRRKNPLSSFRSFSSGGKKSVFIRSWFAFSKLEYYLCETCNSDWNAKTARNK